MVHINVVGAMRALLTSTVCECNHPIRNIHMMEYNITFQRIPLRILRKKKNEREKIAVSAFAHGIHSRT